MVLSQEKLAQSNRTEWAVRLGLSHGTLNTPDQETMWIHLSYSQDDIVLESSSESGEPVVE